MPQHQVFDRPSLSSEPSRNHRRPGARRRAHAALKRLSAGGPDSDPRHGHSAMSESLHAWLGSPRHSDCPGH